MVCLLFQLLHQFVPDLSVHQAVVRGHTGLAGVEEFAERQALGGERDVGGAVHNNRALPPQLQGHRGQVAAGLLHDHFAHIHAAGEENVVKPLLQQGGVLFPAALDDGHPVGVKDGGNELGHGPAGVGGVGAGLENHAVARGHRAEEGVQAQQIGIVPGGHHQHHPIGLGQLIAFGFELGQGGGTPAGAGPLGHMPGQVAQLVQIQSQLTHIPLKVGLVQVGLEGVQQNLLPGLNLFFQPLQGGYPDRHRTGGAGLEEGPLPGHGFLNLGNVGGVTHAHTSLRIPRISS